MISETTILDCEIPIGGIIAWDKNMTGAETLPPFFVECNGQVLSDADSPFDGLTLPDLNTSNRFLRGNTATGGTGGSNANHTHTVTSTVTGATGGSITVWDGYSATTTSSPAESMPPYYDVVFVMRIK